MSSCDMTFNPCVVTRNAVGGFGISEFDREKQCEYSESVQVSTDGSKDPITDITGSAVVV